MDRKYHSYSSICTRNDNSRYIPITMKRLIFSLIFLCIPYLIQAQSISIAPNSMVVWGRTMNTSVFSFNYESVGIHYFYNRETRYDPSGARTRSAVGLSVKPIHYKNFKAGFITFNREFPTVNTTSFNFWLEFGIDIGRVNVSYNHISNAFIGKENLGIDFINLSYKL